VAELSQEPADASRGVANGVAGMGGWDPLIDHHLADRIHDNHRIELLTHQQY
jgi:hypothetical protein